MGYLSPVNLQINNGRPNYAGEPIGNVINTNHVKVKLQMANGKRRDKGANSHVPH